MVRKRVQKSSERSPQPQESAIAPVGARSHSPSSHTQRDMETQEIQQHKHEATTLEIQAKYGTITPQGQERLTFLQAKMADYTQRKLDFANRVYQHMYNSSGGDVSVTPPERNTAPPIQAKLTIGQPGDKYEQEADRVAAQVVNSFHAPTTQCEALPEDEQQKKPEIGSIQRQTMPEDEELQMKSSSAGMTAPQDLETSIQQARGSGQPLADGIKQPMQQAFGADFSGVKIHTDAQSHQLNQSIQARAFTTGQDIFFRQGEYNPGSRGGQELLAHELTHVVQQNGSAVQRSQRQETGQALQTTTSLEQDRLIKGENATVLGESPMQGQGISVAALQHIQRRPQPKSGTTYRDPNFPALELSFQNEDDETGAKIFQTQNNQTLYWDGDSAKEYFIDSSLTTQANMSAYHQNQQNERYYCYNFDVEVPLATAEFSGRSKHQNDRLNNLLSAMRNGFTLPAIKLKKVSDNQYEVVDGNHRLEASRQMNFTKIPVKWQ